ncbi:alpha/beta hydrolase family esterase [Actinocorallia longicatena]|uniref:Polyhydroxybutyrate depolymerase n=1 Tax=Actinocorallia longicatena TaxID=111803 RepID=A0ABP6PW92_9ACTN
MRVLLAWMSLLVLLVPGPAVGAEGPLTRHRSAGGMEYLLAVPEGRGDVPLMVFLHGCGADPAAYGLQEFGERAGFAVLLPLQGGPEGCWDWVGDRRRGAGQLAEIAAVTAEVEDGHPIDAARVFAAGHSAGSGMTANLVSAYPEVYAAAGFVAGCGRWVCSDVTGALAHAEMGARARPVPAYIVWGTADQTNPYASGRLQLLRWLGMNDRADDGRLDLSVPRLPTGLAWHGPDGSRPAFTVETYRSACAPVVFASGHGMGHIPDFTWPDVLPAMTAFLLAHPRTPAC